ncbi:MAG: hypothetical protein ABI134_20905, partial [Byssovorax sp.]
VLALISFFAVVASVTTGHYFATPFAMLFAIGYGYVSVLVMLEQASRRRASAADELATEEAPALLSDRLMASEPPVSGERWAAGARPVSAESTMSADAA